MFKLYMSAAVLFAWPFLVHAQTTATLDKPETRIVPYEEKCEIPDKYISKKSQDRWTDIEAWTWKEICRGRVANLKQKITVDLFSNGEGPKGDGKYLTERTLRPAFFKTVLLEEPFRSAIPNQGIHISWAYFEEEVDLSGVLIEWPLSLEHTVFNSAVNLSRLRAVEFVSLRNSKFKSSLDLGSALIGTDLFLTGGTFNYVNLEEANISGQFNMDRAIFSCPINMYYTRVGRKLSMWDATFRSAFLHWVQVGGTLDMRGSSFTGSLNLDSAKIAGDLIMGGDEVGRTQFEDVLLRGAEISGTLDMRTSKFKSMLLMNSSTVEGDVLLQDATLHDVANLKFLKTGGNFDLQGARSHKLNLFGAQIKGVLKLGSFEKNVVWIGKKPKITLRNLSVGGLQDTNKTWNDEENELDLELDGFTFGHLVGASYMEEYGWRSRTDQQEEPYRRDSSWFIEWLGKDKTYSPQPYLHLASVLRAAGQEDKADDILYQNRELERGLPETSYGRWLLLTGLKLTIGYGYGYFWALVWVAFLVLLGFANLRFHDERSGLERLGFWYSLDMLLPVIRLREDHYKVDLQNKQVRYHFYLHKIIGYLLTFFVLAGLSGLTE